MHCRILLLLAVLTGPAALAGGAECNDRDADGFFFETGCGTAPDCNDADPATHPFANDGCDGVDNDCNGSLDDAPDCVQICHLPGDGPDRRIDGILDSAPVVDFVWTGSGYGVAWSARDLPFERLEFLLLDDQGEELGSPTSVRAHAGSVRGPSLVWTGTEFGVAWWDDSTGNAEVHFARLDRDGNLIEPPLPVTEDEGASRWPSLVWTGNGYGIAWFDNRTGSDEIFFARLDAQGVKQGDDVPLTTAGGATYPILVWSGSGYGVAYTAALRKRFLRLDADGNPADTPIDVGPGLVGSMVWTGELYAIAGPNSPSNIREFWFSQLDAVGEQVGIDVPTVARGGQGSLSALAWTGTEFGLFWADTNGTIAMTRLTAFGFPVGDVLPVSLGSSPARQPVPRWTGSHFDVIWVGGADGDSAVWFDRILCPCDEGFPGATEVCNGLDDDCDGLVDEDLPFVDSDFDGQCDPADNCPLQPNTYQEDTDQDGLGNACDNCPFEANGRQSDRDLDGQGNVCDVDDGLIWIHFNRQEEVDWDDEQAWPGWNIYRGSLRVLREEGTYTQTPLSNPLAFAYCGLSQSSSWQLVVPPTGEVVFFLVTGIEADTESDLGTTGDGTPRPNTNPCP